MTTRIRTHRLALAIAAALVPTAPRVLLAQPSYTITEIGLGEAHDINNAGQVTGHLGSPTGYQAILWQGWINYLGTLGGDYSLGYGINEAGDVVGASEMADGGVHAFLWTAGGGMVDLGTLPGKNASEALAINDLGQVVGVSYQRSPTGGFSDPRAFLWLPAPAYGLSAGMNDLGTLGGLSAWARDINNWGEVAGHAQNSGGTFHAYLWLPSGAYGLPSGMNDLGTFPGMSWSVGRGINDVGAVVGDGLFEILPGGGNWEHAFLWQGWPFVDLGALLTPPTPGRSHAYEINNCGDIVGSSDAGNIGCPIPPCAGTPDHAVLWKDGNMYDLADHVLPANPLLLLYDAPAINDSGEIAAYGNQNGAYNVSYAFVLTPAAAGGPDCNANGIPDDCDVAAGHSLDCNANVIPDECESQNDCNANGVQDICELAGNDCNFNLVPDDCDVAAGDCNGNGIPDDCELAGNDCNANGVPDDCELAGNDCNANVQPDDCDIAGGASTDCDGNGLPDDCELAGNDCNGNGVFDPCELFWQDCNGNGVIDECDIAAGTSPDCNADGIVDSCQLGGNDCNANGIPDDCELIGNDCNANGAPDDCDVAATDCNANGAPDDCDIASGTSSDCNADGVPDTCQLTGNDCNANGVPDECELTGNDCNADAVPDDCQLSGNDCNADGLPDDCQLAGNDCNTTGVPDDCEVIGNDCNSNGAPDECDLGNPASGQPQDACAAAEPACPGVVYSGTTLGAANDGAAGCGSSSTSPDVWYRYTAASSGLLTVSLCGSSYDTVVSVHTACPGGLGNEIACNDDTCGTQSEVTVAIVPGDYWIRIAGFSGSAGTFVMSLTGPACRPGNDCNTNGVPDECDIASGAAGDCNGNGVPDTCEPPTDCNANGIQDICELAVNDCNTNGIPDDCDIVLDAAASAATDQCAAAEPTCPGAIYLGNSAAATNDGSSSCGSSETSPDMWYKYVPATAGTLTVSLCGSLYDTVVSVHTGCPGDAFNQIACSDDWCGTRSQVSVDVAPGDYWIRIAGFNGAVGDFTATLTGPPCSLDCNANGLPDECELTGNDCNVSGVPDECELAGNDCNGNGVPDECDPPDDCNTNGIQDICELVGNDCNHNSVPDECELAVGDCNGNGLPDDCDISADPAASAPQDDCVAAEPVCPGVVYTGTTDAATADGASSCDYVNVPDSPDVWYKYVPATAGVATISLCGSSFDTVLSVHSGCPGNVASELACNDDACGTQSEVTLNVTPRVYWIRVAGYFGYTGPFTLTVTGPACDWSADCNTNGLPDECDVGAGSSQDCNSNVVPDECEVVASDGLTGLAFEFDATPPVAWDWAQSCDDCSTGPVPLGFAVQLGGQSFTRFEQDSNGYVELLGPTETPYGYSYGPVSGLTGFGNPTHTFLMAAYDDLTSWYQGQFGYRAAPDRVTFFWETETFCDGGTGALSVFQVVLYADGRVQWNFSSSAVTCWDEDLFSGLYLGYARQELYEIVRGGVPAQESWLFARTSPNDCNGDGVPDDCQLIGNDCNTNGVPDACDIAAGTLSDLNGDGIPDQCVCGDLDHDGDVDGADFALFLFTFGRSGGTIEYNAEADFDGDGTITLVDYQAWLQCYRDFIGGPLAPPPAIVQGDFDADQDVDLADFAYYQDCLAGAPTIEFACVTVFDFDGDQAVRRPDYHGWNEALTGP